MPVYHSLVDAAFKVKNLEREKATKLDSTRWKRLNWSLPSNVPGNVFHVGHRQIWIQEVDWRPWEPTNPRHESISVQAIPSIWSHKQLEQMPQNSVQRSLRMRAMGLHLPTLMKARKIRKRKHPLETITCFKCQEKVNICTNVQENKEKLTCCLMGKKLKSAWMKMILHSSLLQYSENNQTEVWTKIGSCLTINLQLMCLLRQATKQHQRIWDFHAVAAALQCWYHAYQAHWWPASIWRSMVSQKRHCIHTILGKCQKQT